MPYYTIIYGFGCFYKLQYKSACMQIQCSPLLPCGRWERTKRQTTNYSSTILTSSTLLPIVGDVWTTSLIKL